MMTPMDPQDPRHAHAEPHAPLIDSMTLHERPVYTRRGNPVVPPDPGTPTSRAMAVLLALVFAGLVIVWQNLGPERQDRVVGAPPTPPVAEAVDQPAPGAAAEMMGVIYLRLKAVFQADPKAGEQIAGMVEQFGSTRADQVRAAVVAAEFEGPDAGLKRLDTLESEIHSAPSADDDTPDAGADVAPITEESRALLAAEVQALRTVYTAGPDALGATQRDQLSARYGRIGDYALTFGQPEEQREAVIGSPWPVVAFGVVVLMLIGGGLLGGLVALIIGVVWYSGRRAVMHGQKPLPGGSVFLETYALFVACFAVLGIGTHVIEAHAPQRVVEIVGMLGLPLQWLLALTVFWPVVRGMSFRSWRHAVGLTRGQGVFREVGCGMVAYLASIPLYAVGVGISALLMVAWEAVRQSLGFKGEPAPPNNPIVDLVGSKSPVLIALVFLLATMWAPFTEELIFRGSLFRHFRGRVHWTLAALGSAVLFAYMHSYGPLLVAPLIALGFMFAFMREWRGSIIASMTAHFLHNFTLMTLMITALFALT